MKLKLKSLPIFGLFLISFSANSQCSVILAPTDPSCFSDCNGMIEATPSGGVAPYSFQWVDDLGAPIGTNSNQISGLCAGTYGVQVTDANGCSPALSATNLVEPAAITFNPMITDASCFGECDGEIQINANGGTGALTYQWNFGVSGNQSGAAQQICQGTYNVDVNDINGCSENLSYLIDQPENLIFQSIVTTDEGCIPTQCVGSVQVSATGATKYSLDGIVNLAGDFQNLCKGNYTLIAGNSAGCEITEIVTINPEDRPYANFASFQSEMALPDNDLITFNSSTNSTNYEWTVKAPNFDFTSSETELNLALPYVEANYEVCLIASNQTTCKDTVCRFVDVRDEFTIWVPNSFTPDGDEYNNVFEPVISNVDGQAYDFYIFDRWGHLVFESHDLNQGWDGSFQGSYVPAGIYVWKIRLKSIDTDEFREYSGQVNMLK